MSKKTLVTAIIAGLILLTGMCLYLVAQKIAGQPATNLKQNQTSVEQRAEEVLLALKDKNAEQLAGLVHPEKGVRFSPYAFVNANMHRFLPTEVKEIFSNTNKIFWGNYDGSGEPIQVTFNEYYDKFIFDHDFTQAPEISFTETLGQGNSLNNAKAVYPGAMVIEYHFSGFEPKYEGMDWSSLRLVFEQKDGVWYLIGVIHDQWTI